MIGYFLGLSIKNSLGNVFAGDCKRKSVGDRHSQINTLVFHGKSKDDWPLATLECAGESPAILRSRITLTPKIVPMTATIAPRAIRSARF